MALINLATVLLSCLLISSGIRQSQCTKFTLTNYCNEMIWPGITPNNFSTGGFALKPNQSAVFTTPQAWRGRIWARTACNFDKNGNGTCQTGDCGSRVQCSGPGNPPSTIAEFSLGDNIDYYDVSLVDGFNVPMVVQPLGSKGNCSAAGCDTDLRPDCPPELALRSSDGKTVACRSACNVFDKDEYCCRGEFSTPMTCLATNYSRIFKTACPAASSFAYDNSTAIISCSESPTDYMVTFCSARNQTQCTYHDNKLACNGGSGLLKMKQFSQVWNNFLMPFSLAISVPLLLLL